MFRTLILLIVPDGCDSAEKRNSFTDFCDPSGQTTFPIMKWYDMLYLWRIYRISHYQTNVIHLIHCKKRKTITDVSY